MFRAIISILLIFWVPASFAAFCAHWEEAKQIGTLPRKFVKEVSGMTVSKKIPDRVYWVNDSGDKGHFYFSHADGSGLTQVNVTNFKPADTEALSLTECPEGACLAFGDIGDNQSKRKDIEIMFVRDENEFAGETKILRRLKLEYPDRAHDAEALFFLPNGDLVIVTKEFRLMQLSSEAAGVYTLPRAQWQEAGEKPVKLKKLGELALPSWLPDELVFAHTVTDAAVNTKRNVLILLTYTGAVEIPLDKLKDLSGSKDWKRDKDFALVPVKALKQQESITYSADGDRVLWSTEFMPPDSPIFSMACSRAVP